MIDDTKIDISFIKRDLVKLYHQQKAQQKDYDKNTEFNCEKKMNYYETGNAFLYFEVTLEKNW